MKKTVAATFLVTAALCGLALTETSVQGAEAQQQAQQQGGSERVAALERDLADAKERCRKLEVDLLDVQGQLVLIKQHLEAQAQAATAMQATLDASEEAGFTYGINPESRHLLLAGWRAKLSAEQKALAPAPVESPRNARGRR
jgi:TolA-binding protein